MAKTTRGKRRSESRAERRVRAARLFDAGASQAEVSRRLDVSAVSAMRWHRVWRRRGIEGLAAKPPLGRPARLTAKQAQHVEQILLDGPSKHGFTTDLWTLPRIATAIERETGVRFHAAHLSRLLRGMGWSLQRPAKRARERDEEAIRRWRKDRWPTLKKNFRTLIFMDESGFSEGSVIRRTWAPRGQTPILRPKGRSWRWMSAIGALVYQQRRSRLLLLFQRGPVRGPGVLRFLRHLRRHTRGSVLLLWDGLQAHRAAIVKDWLIANRHWLHVERLPGYAPELNPVEGFWAWLKGTSLANVCTDDLEPLVELARNGSRRLRRRPTLLRSFLGKAGLSL
jgi:transposase